MFRLITIILCLTLLVVWTDQVVFAQKTMSVQIREGQLRATPSHLGKIVARASYGDPVTVLEERGDWRKVSLEGGKYQGWIHKSALTGQKIALKAGQTNVKSSVSRDEIALAGKGFSKEVEAQYRQNNRNLDYTWINRMETFKVSPEQMQEFILEGKLAAGVQGGKP